MCSKCYTRVIRSADIMSYWPSILLLCFFDTHSIVDLVLGHTVKVELEISPTRYKNFTGIIRREIWLQILTPVAFKSPPFHKRAIYLKSIYGSSVVSLCSMYNPNLYGPSSVNIKSHVCHRVR